VLPNIEKINTNKPLRIKFGVDPTAESLHLGHFSILRKLNKFQEQGHIAVIIIGDFTATIGDPTGRSNARKPLTQEQVNINADKIETQIRNILLPENLEIHRNKTWLSNLPTEELFNKLSMVGVNTILSRQDFKTRMNNGDRIGCNEMMYPILQAIDSIMINSDLEIGGNDQKFNLLLARTLQKKMGQKPQAIALLPLLPNNKGSKMGKSVSGCISLNLSINQIHDKLISTPDNLIDEFLNILTDEKNHQLLEPQDKQKLLANNVIEQLTQLNII
jgi:tyrosyl-tRNA synthetase